MTVVLSVLMLAQAMPASVWAADPAPDPSGPATTEEPTASPSATASPSGSEVSTPVPSDPATNLEPSPLASSEVSGEPDPASELVDQRTATSRSFRGADGTVTTEIFPDAIHYQPDGSTSWEPIDLTFAPTAAGSKTAKVDKSPTKVTVAPADDATGFLAVELGGQQVALRPATPSASSAAPTLDGAEADVPDIYPGVDLRVFAAADGVNAFLVLREEPATPSFAFIVDAPTLSLSLDKATKRLLLKNGQSVQVGSFLSPYASTRRPTS